VYVKDNNGCTYSTFTTITQSATVLTLAAAATPSSGGNNGAINATAGGGTAPYTYALNGGVSQSGGSFTGLANGSYTVSATDAAGCIRTYVLQVVSPESLTDVQFAKDISLYPNPAHDYIQLNIQDGTSAVQISITNAVGQTVARDYAFATGSGVSKRISTAHLAAGTYNMLIIDENKRTAVKKFVVQ
jgi:large repetitive protein